MKFSNLYVESFAGGDNWDGWTLFDYIHIWHMEYG